jgi:type-F conjugative transfer system pilin assembly protein TrbC
MLRWLYFQLILSQFILSAQLANAVGFIDTNDSCLVVEKEEGSVVFLKRVGECTGKPGRAFVKSDEKSNVRIFIDGHYVEDAAVKPLQMVDISNVMEKAASMGKGIKTEENRFAAEGIKAAEKVKEFYDSPEFQEKLKVETERLQKSLFSEQFESYYKDSNAKTSSKGMGLGDDERLYIFVSSSIPVSVLRTYAVDVSKLGGRRVIMVMRGFVDGMTKIMPTMEFVSRVLQTDPACSAKNGEKCNILAIPFIVDPMLFRRYGIETVPSFAYVKGLKSTDPDMSEGVGNHAKVSGDVLKLSGDASLKYVIEQFHNSTKARSLENFINNL